MMMSTPRLRVVVAGGGTGGHLYPGIAVARRFEVRCPGSQIVFLGRRDGLAARVLEGEGFPVYHVWVKALRGRSKAAQVWALLTLAIGVLQAVKILRRIRPHLVIGTGGYVMGPAILAAALLRIPRVILEQNLIPGTAVRRLSRFAQMVFSSFPHTADYLPAAPVAYTGTPVRQDICEMGRSSRKRQNATLQILIIGGSQGAHRINQAVIDALPLFASQRDRLCMAHQTGEADCDAVAQAYQRAGWQAEVAPFFFDMAARYRWADLVLCRAGASTLAELTACGKPAILVPYPYAADDHQRLNAQALQQQGAAQVILDAELTGERLYQVIHGLLSHPERLCRQAAHSSRLGKPQAADYIVTLCLQLIALPGT
jgi:UDP-N-acetylglucosamine--N-acetylmuramyl-(pentapeptide) pyrophosphoryl-undecaprenol N-acetylglucosamine transferase